MRTDIVLRITLWLVRHCGAESAGEAFAGDLLEMFARGRSAWWCLAQALQREAFSVEFRLRALSLPVGYCCAFVLLHPVWQGLYVPSVARLLKSYRGTTVWPGSAVLEIATGMLPAVLFVWVGAFLFLLLQQQPLPRSNRVRVLLSLSIGCCVVSAETVLRLGALGHDLRTLSRLDFYYPVSHSRFSVLLFVALFAAVSLLPREPRLSGRSGYARAKAAVQVLLGRRARAVFGRLNGTERRCLESSCTSIYRRVTPDGAAAAGTSMLRLP